MVGMATASTRITGCFLIAKLHVFLLIWHWILLLCFGLLVSVIAHYFLNAAFTLPLVLTLVMPCLRERVERNRSRFVVICA
jgi:hypothetical protein